MNPISHLLLVVVLVFATGTASAAAENPGIGHPVVGKGSDAKLEVGVPLVVPTAPCPGFAPDPLVFDWSGVSYDFLSKFWFESAGFGEWQELKTKWSGSVTVGNLTYTLRGDLFLSEPAGSDNFGSGRFVLTRSDGARMSGHVLSLSYFPEPSPTGGWTVVWEEVRCR